jgi:hypothetical protein
MMFESAFHWSIKHGARVLFVFAILFTFGAVLSDLLIIAQKFGVQFNDPNGSALSYTPTETLFRALLSPFSTPVSLLFSVLVVNHLDRWANERRDGKL